MKNKHLVLLFLLTLLIGLAVRRAPWRNATFFQTNLLRLDTAAVQQLQITLPHSPVLVLQKGDAGWSAEQQDRTIPAPAELLDQMLGALAEMRSIRIAKTQKPDTLGFEPAHSIRVVWINAENQLDSLILGWETIENAQPATYVRLPRHEGIYLVNNHLRRIFSKKLNDFRLRTLARFVPAEVAHFSLLQGRKDTLVFEKNDSLKLWYDPQHILMVPDSAVQAWFLLLNNITDLAYADLFDESHVQDYFFAQVRLLTADQNARPIHLTVYRLKQQNFPEELPSQKPDLRQLAPYVLHSSQNPSNYFAFSDTNLLKRLCRPFKL